MRDIKLTEHHATTAYIRPSSFINPSIYKFLPNSSPIKPLIWQLLLWISRFPLVKTFRIPSHWLYIIKFTTMKIRISSELSFSKRPKLERISQLYVLNWYEISTTRHPIKTLFLQDVNYVTFSLLFDLASTSTVSKFTSIVFSLHHWNNENVKKRRQPMWIRPLRPSEDHRLSIRFSRHFNLERTPITKHPPPLSEFRILDWNALLLQGTSSRKLWNASLPKSTRPTLRPFWWLKIMS